MALTVYQEMIPLSNERISTQISSTGSYSNPIVMPLSFDTSGYSNIVETVLYIRNDNISKYYEYVVIGLHTSTTSSSYTTATIKKVNSIDIISFPNVPVEIPIEFTIEGHSIGTNQYQLTNQYHTGTIPISPSNTDYQVKFSYGYDSLSDYDWSMRKSMLVIPSLGNASMPDISYIPIRMRLNILKSQPVYTIRELHLDISFYQEKAVTAS